MRKWLVLSASLLFGPLLSGAESTVPAVPLQQILGNMKLRSQSVQSLQFRFEQEVTFLNSSLVSKTEGDALFEKPNKMNVHMKKPQEQQTIANGNKTWVYTPSYKQVWVGNGKKDFSSLLPKGMVPINNLGEDLEKNYTLSIMKGDQKRQASAVSGSSDTVVEEVYLLATPKQPSDYHLEFVISTESWLPKETVYVTSSAKVVTKMSSTRVNPNVEANSFQFVAPPGTDIIPF